MNKVLQLIRRAGKAAGHFFKSVFRQKGVKRYILLTLVSTMVFIFIMFPYNKLANKFLKSAKIPGVRSLDVSGLDISPSGKASASLLTIVDMKNRTIELVNPDLKFAPFALVFKNRFKADFSSDKLSYITPTRKIHGNLAMNADFIFNRKERRVLSGMLTANAKNVTVSGIKVMEFTIPDITFSAIQAEINYENDVVTFSRLQFGGKDLKGRIAGTIQMNTERMNSSTYNLTITINADSGIIENYRMLISNYLNPSSGNLEIQVTGTLASPKYKFVR